MESFNNWLSDRFEDGWHVCLAIIVFKALVARFLVLPRPIHRKFPEFHNVLIEVCGSHFIVVFFYATVFYLARLIA